ncbi:MAG TPA: lamin tail domain-containing protein [Candidatus Methanofastidiosa archaeon]|nr:lamin tail domain-containing protein [Candidatus Methanofastidiosa archaeon]
MKIKVFIASLTILALIGSMAISMVSAECIVPGEWQDSVSESVPDTDLFQGYFQPPYDEDENDDGGIELYINELMADNDITIEGPDGDYPDWIELYNASDETIDLSGMYLTDDPNKPKLWKFPEGTEIEAGEYLLIWADGRPSDDDELHVPFRLNANGDSVALYASDGETLIDSITFHKQIRDTSYGRLPDASDELSYMSTPTPGESNDVNGESGTSWVVPAIIVASALMMIGLVAIREARRPRE